MTKEGILAMEAGRDLDLLVAKEIIGTIPVDFYSTDISAALQIIEKEGAWDIKKRFRPHPDDPPGTGGRATYRAMCFLSDYDEYEDALINKRAGRSPWCWQLPEAICKASLLAKLEVKE